MSGWRQYLISQDYNIRIVPTVMVEIFRHVISRVFVDYIVLIKSGPD